MNAIARRFGMLTGLAALTSMVACADAPRDSGPLSSAAGALVGVSGDDCTTLVAGQHIGVGSLCVEVSGDNLAVTFETARDWTIAEAHLWAGTSLAEMPQTSGGNPQIGRFPYYAAGPTSSVTFEVPLSTFGLSASDAECAPVSALLTAHASVTRVNDDGSVQQETAWGAGSPVTPRGSWATYSTFGLVCSSVEPPPEETWECEGTAIAYNGDLSTCFSEYGFARWGWTNGPFGPGTYTFDVLEGAGLCDVSKGTKVATATVEYDGSSAVVTVDAVEGDRFSEIHMYIGSEAFPRDRGAYTVAWGKYPYNRGGEDMASSWQAVIDGLEGNVHFVLHVVDCDPVGGGDDSAYESR